MPVDTWGRMLGLFMLGLNVMLADHLMGVLRQTGMPMTRLAWMTLAAGGVAASIAVTQIVLG